MEMGYVTQPMPKITLEAVEKRITSIVRNNNPIYRSRELEGKFGLRVNAAYPLKPTLTALFECFYQLCNFVHSGIMSRLG